MIKKVPMNYWRLNEQTLINVRRDDSVILKFDNMQINETVPTRICQSIIKIMPKTLILSLNPYARCTETSSRGVMNN